MDGYGGRRGGLGGGHTGGEGGVEGRGEVTLARREAWRAAGRESHWLGGRRGGPGGGSTGWEWPCVCEGCVWVLSLV